MNLGELRVNPGVANSHAQLNNDWFVSKNSETLSFENILANKTQERSEVKRELKPKVKPKFEKHHDVIRPVQKQEYKQEDDVKALKETINDVIAKKKFGKENVIENTDKPTLEELNAKLQALEEAIKEELGITEKPEALELIAQLLGIDLETLVEQVSAGMDEETKEVFVELVTTKLEDDSINPKQLLKELKQMFASLKKPDRVTLEAIVSDVVEKLAEGEIKEAFVKFDSVLEAVIKNQNPEVVVEAAAVTSLPKIEVAQSEKTVVETVAINVKQVVQETTTEGKTSTQHEQPSEKGSEPSNNLTIKTAIEGNTEKVTVEEQINLMKAENTTIVSRKITPKVALSRSVMNQVIQGTKMSIAISDQSSEILVKLNPKNLGNVSLKMSFEKGALLAQIQVENQTVKGIIESNLDDLKNALKNEGYEIGELDVSVNKENTGDQNQQNFSQNKKRNLRLETFEDIEEKLNKENIAGDKAIDYLA